MSVYSGFATRQQQTKYNNLLETLVIGIKKRLIKFYTGEKCDESKFKLLLKKIFKKMYLLEKGKFMTPKYTSCFSDLIDTLQININYDTLSDVSSMMSQTFSLQKQSQQMERQQFKSNAILQNKKNFLQTKIQHHNNGINLSTLSLNKKLHTLDIENQQQQLIQESSKGNSLGLVQNLKSKKAKIKLRQLKNLKDVRGTMHMPKVQDFLPKKQQLEPVLFRRPNILEVPRQHKVFRRQKYSKQDASIEDI